MKKLKNLNGYKTLKENVVTKLNHLNCDKIREKKLWQKWSKKKSKTQQENLNQIIFVATIYTSSKCFYSINHKKKNLYKHT